MSLEEWVGPVMLGDDEITATVEYELDWEGRYRANVTITAILSGDEDVMPHVTLKELDRLMEQIAEREESFGNPKYVRDEDDDDDR